jgi:sulfonate transport system permease protein
MSVLQMSVGNELAEPRLRQRRHWLVRWSRPALGLLLPLGLALGWEICVRAGLFSGRLVPPPSVIYATFAELARTGELQSHALTTLARVAAGFAIGVGVGTLLGAVTGYSALVRVSSIRVFRHCAQYRQLPGYPSLFSGWAYSKHPRSH